MVTSCCVVDCKNRHTPGNGIAFFRFPKPTSKHPPQKQKLLSKRRKEWIIAVNRKTPKGCKTINYNTLRICSYHFQSGQPSHLLNTSDVDWVPSLLMGYQTKAEKRNVESSSNTHKRWINRQTQKKTNEPEISSVQNPLVTTDHATEEDVPIIEVIENSVLEAECVLPSLSSKNIQVTSSNQKSKVSHSLPFTEETFAGDDEKLKFYTGVKSMALLEFFLDHLKPNLVTLFKCPSLTPFQMLLLTLMKLKFDDSFTRLGYDFDVCPFMASKIFRKVIVLFAYVFKNAIYWPTEDAIKHSTPESFLGLQQSVGGRAIRVIIDCFEIKVEKAASNKGKSQLFSSYKHYHTLKYLIGITPFGLVSFISNGWGGRTSDTELTQNSGFLDFLQPGDVVLADRGFGTSVREMIEKRNATLLTPAFAKSNKQFHPTEIEETRAIACRRIHVERVIGQLRNKFKIICGPVPITMLEYEYAGDNLFDYVVRVCCIICNSSDPVIKK